jgi:hypothetical protein
MSFDKYSNLPASEITPEALFKSRRDFMRMAAAASVAAVFPEATSALLNCLMVMKNTLRNFIKDWI